jgi:uncharacterized linocin/CFP29 family protein
LRHLRFRFSCREDHPRTPLTRRGNRGSCCGETTARRVRPYGLALGPEAHTRVLESSEHGGYPLLDHLRKILRGPLVRVPGIQSAAVVSMRGGDFLFDSGEDVSIGYEHDTRRPSISI